MRLLRPIGLCLMGPAALNAPGCDSRAAASRLSGLATSLGSPSVSGGGPRASASPSPACLSRSGSEHVQSGRSHGEQSGPLPPRLEQLKGKTIDPHVASAHMDYVEFDGTGKVHRWKTPHVPGPVLDALEGAQTRPLSRVNSRHPREHARTEKDTLIQFMALLRKAPGAEAKALLNQGKSLWLSGDTRPERISAYLKQAAGKLHQNTGLQSLAQELHLHTRKEKTPVQYHENIYGRRFDSELAHELVRHPPPATLASSQALGRALTAHFDTFFADLDEATRQTQLDALKTRIQKDSRQWFGETPDLQALADTPTLHALKETLNKVESGADLLKINYLAVNLSLLTRDDAADPWMQYADTNYDLVVKPARSTHPTLAETRTQNYGIRLHYQPDYDAYARLQDAKSWTDAKSPDLYDPTPFEERALNAGHAIVNGASGSANIMTFLLQHMSGKYPDIDQDAAMLGTLAFLTFDGGHSFNEAMVVRDAVKAVPDPTDGTVDFNTFFNRNELVSDYQLDYRHLGDLGDRPALAKALDVALDKTLDYFDEHSFFAAQNQDVLAHLPSTSHS